MAAARLSSNRRWRLSFGETTAILQKMVLSCILAAVCLSALVFPYRLPDPLFREIETIPPTAGWWPWLYHTQLRSYLLYTHSPLVLKETIAQAFLLAGAVAFLVIMVLRAMWKQRLPIPLIDRLKGWVTSPVAWAMLLLLYLSATLTVSPTFHYSLRTLFAFALGIFVPVALIMLRPGPQILNKFMVAIMCCGTIIGGIALLQHLSLARWFLPGYDDPRNRMSSLIGHNTGMSSWLMFPLSFALYFAQTAKRSWIKWGAIAHVLLFGFVILAAQSRAIWVLAAVIVVVSLVWNFRLQGRRLTRRTLSIIIIAVLGLIALQTVAPKVNPFARTPMTFFERLRKDVLNPQQLMRETRLRIMAVSLAELVPKRPLFGSGFGTFQWVYPPAQGDYFEERIANTDLGFTTKRTDLAHNDYLQVLVEGGLIGVALFAIPTILLVRRSRRAYQRALDTRSKARLVALATPLGAVAVHAFVDFPFHVVPIGLVAAACLGLLASQGEVVSKEVQVDPAVSSEFHPADNGIVRWRPVLLASILLFSTFWVPLASRDFLYRELASDIFNSDASNWLRSFRAVPPTNTDQQIYMLDQARPLFRRAIQLNVFNGAAYEGQASLLASRGNLFYTMGRRALQAGNTEMAEKYFTVARGDLELTITTAQNQVKNGELFYHFTYYLIGTAYRTLWLLNPDAQNIRQLNYLKSASAAYKAAIDTNIADTASLAALIDIHDSPPLQEPSTVTRYMGIYLRVDEEGVRRTYLEPAITLAAEGNTPAALARLQTIGAQLPKTPLLDIAYAWIYLYSSVWLPPELDRIEVPGTATLDWRKQHFAGGLPYVERLAKLEEPRLQPEVQLIKALYAAARLDFESVVKLTEPIASTDVRAETLRDLASEELNPKTSLHRADYWYDRYKGLYSVYFRSGDAKQVAAFKAGVAAKFVKIEMKEALRLLYTYKANGWQEASKILLDLLSKHYPNDPRLQAYAPPPAAPAP